jgi:hypothetical protein
MIRSNNGTVLFDDICRDPQVSTFTKSFQGEAYVEIMVYDYDRGYSFKGSGLDLLVTKELVKDTDSRCDK